jgi:hypothetical protein
MVRPRKTSRDESRSCVRINLSFFVKKQEEAAGHHPFLQEGIPFFSDYINRNVPQGGTLFLSSWL